MISKHLLSISPNQQEFEKVTQNTIPLSGTMDIAKLSNILNTTVPTPVQMKVRTQ